MKKTLNCKLMGENAELKFLMIASSKGFRVSKPYGDSAPYDFIVEYDNWVRRVQVKSTRHKEKDSYRVKCIRSNWQKSYLPGQIDLFAAFVEPCNAWYIIPAHELLTQIKFCVRPHFEQWPGKWEKYREAWHLLRE